MCSRQGGMSKRKATNYGHNNGSTVFSNKSTPLPQKEKKETSKRYHEEQELATIAARAMHIYVNMRAEMLRARYRDT